MTTTTKKYWHCILEMEVPEGQDLPDGFDAIPRKAVTEAINNAGFQVPHIFSGCDSTGETMAQFSKLIRMTKDE